MVHVDRFVAIERELAADLPAIKCLGFLLRYPDEDDRIPHRTLAAEFIGQVVFLLFMPELVNRNPVPFCQFLHRLAEILRDLPQHHRGGDRLVQLISHEEHQPWPGCQFAYITVQIQPVQTLHFQGYVSIE